MTWARFDDQFPDHPKIDRVGGLGLALQAAAVCYCARYLTDGFVSAERAGLLVASVMNGPGTAKGARSIDWPKLMVNAGLWDEIEGGFRVHDYLDFNPSKADVEADRQAKHRAQIAGGQARAASAMRGVRGRFTSNDSSGLAGEKLEEAPPASDHLPSPSPVVSSSLKSTPTVQVSLSRKLTPPTSSVPASETGPTPEDVLAAWNENRGSLSSASLTPGRQRHVAARIRDGLTLERWGGVVKRVAASTFLTGGGEKGWRATIDWLLKPESIVRVEEGQFDDAPNRGPRRDWLHTTPGRYSDVPARTIATEEETDR